MQVLNLLLVPTYPTSNNTDISATQNVGLDTVSYIVTNVSGYAATVIPNTRNINYYPTEKSVTSDTYYGQRFKLRYKYNDTFNWS